MRFSNKLSLFVITAFAATAFATSAASAAAIELDEQGAPPETHCSTVATNCTVHLAGGMTIQLSSMQVVTFCTLEFVADFNENGSGTVRSVSFTGPACFNQNCPAPEGVWPIAAMQENAGIVTSIMRFCLSGPGGIQAHCNLPLRLTEDPANPHDYMVTTSTGNEFQCPSTNWVTINLETESPHLAAEYDEMEIEHDAQ